jgi:X-linked retinitis pigmentosa GTPase regulator
MEIEQTDEDESTNVINSLSELIYPTSQQQQQQQQQQKQPEQVEIEKPVEAVEAIEKHESEETNDTDTESYDYTQENADLSGPIDIDIATENHENVDHYEDNEIPDVHNDISDTEFIQHETQQLNQQSDQISGQLLQIVEESTPIDENLIETTAYADEVENQSESAFDSSSSSNNNNDEDNNLNQTGENEITQTYDVDDDDEEEKLPTEIPVAQSQMIDRENDVSEKEIEAAENGNIEEERMEITTAHENSDKIENKDEAIISTTTSNIAPATDVDEEAEINNTPTYEPVENESQSTQVHENEVTSEFNDNVKNDVNDDQTTLAHVSEISSVTTDMPIDLTTQAILDLTTRTAIMEPNSEISSTIANFIYTNDDAVATTTTTTTISSLVTGEIIKDTRRKID